MFRVTWMEHLRKMDNQPTPKNGVNVSIVPAIGLNSNPLFTGNQPARDMNHVGWSLGTYRFHGAFCKPFVYIHNHPNFTGKKGKNLLPSIGWGLVIDFSWWFTYLDLHGHNAWKKVTQKYSPKWWWMMVMNPMVESVKNHQTRPNPRSRWFKVTFSSASWRSLTLWKGHLTTPKGSQRIARMVYLPRCSFI